MADLKPLGSEKLNGDEKLKRILELTYYNQKNKNINESKPDLVKESTSGGVYGIVREKDGYYVKKGLNESTLDYIGGIFMKNKNKFSSYAEALKRLELLKGQEELQEATKYVLKTNKPKEEAPMPEPAMDDMPPMDAALPPADGGEAPASDEPMPELPAGDEMGGEEEAPAESKRSDYMAEAQKHAGRLGQELRDIKDKMESDDIKYILNMIISAVDLDKLDDEDIEDIAEKFERDEEQGEEEGGEFDFSGEEPEGEEVPAPAEEPADEELDETIDMLDSFINSSLDEYMDEELMELNIDDYADLEDESDSVEYRPEYVSPELEMDEEMLEYDESMGDDDYEYHNGLRDEMSMGDDDYEYHNGLRDEIEMGENLRGFNPGKNWSDEKKVMKLKSNGRENLRGFNPGKNWSDERKAMKLNDKDDEVEIDLEEIKREINNSINSTLGKYFK